MVGSIRPAEAEAAMCSVQYLRDFIKERLTAACEEIFSEVQKTIVHYEEEISRQRRLLDISRKPDTHSHITDHPHDCEEEDDLDEQQVCNFERNSSLDKENPEPPMIEEEQEELCSSQEGEQLGMKQEAESIWTDEEQLRLLKTMWKPEIKLHRIDLQQRVYEEEILTEQWVCNQQRNSSLNQEDPEPTWIKKEQEEFCSNQEGEQLGLKQEADTFMVTPTYEESNHSQSETKSEQFLSQSAPEAESQDEEERQHMDSGSTINAELKKRRDNAQRGDNAPVSESQNQTDRRKKCVQCDICGKTYHHKSNLTRHLTSHTGEKHFPCSTCEKRFSRKSDLERHIRIHTGEKPYACTTCEKRFSDLSAFIKHVRCHTGEKPYSCGMCGKGFNRKFDLVYHIKSHMGDKPYRCNTCGNRFSQKGNLKTHMKIHAG